MGHTLSADGSGVSGGCACRGGYFADGGTKDFRNIGMAIRALPKEGGMSLSADGGRGRPYD